MKLWMIRHGDPDYVRDSLTEKGRREARLLAGRPELAGVRDFYVSPLGRARATADYTLKRLRRSATELDWLKEFPARVDVNGSPELQRAFPDTGREADGSFRNRIAWDMVPGGWRNDPSYYGETSWRESLVARHSDLADVYDRVAEGLDELLAGYGYRRDGKLYRTEGGNNDTIALFCHFGISCVMLSHLWGISPFLPWHCLAMAPTSVTELCTEEREKGIVLFRATRIGDISHLYAGQEPPSFSARFCETYENDWERH